MAKVKLNLDELTPLEMLQLTDLIIQKMTGNPTFPAPNPTLTAMQGFRDTVNTKNIQAKATRALSEQHTGELNVAMKALKGGLTTEGGYVESTSLGDEVKIRSAGMDVRDPAAPIGQLPQVMNLVLTSGDLDGELDASWDRIKGSRVFEVQTSADPFSAGSWATKAQPTASKVTLTGLPSGTRVWVRVRAIGTAGPGPWSDPAVKIVP